MTRDELIAAITATAKPELRKHEVPGWGIVYTRPLSLEQLERQQKAEPAEPGLEYARNAACVLCDENGVLLFDPENLEHLKVLAAQDWMRMAAVIGTAVKDDATTEEGVEAAKNG